MLGSLRGGGTRDSEGDVGAGTATMTTPAPAAAGTAGYLRRQGVLVLNRCDARADVTGNPDGGGSDRRSRVGGALFRGSGGAPRGGGRLGCGQRSEVDGPHVLGGTCG